MCVVGVAFLLVRRREAADDVLAAAAWLAPLSLLIGFESLWTAPAAVLFGTQVSLALRRFQTRDEDDELEPHSFLAPLEVTEAETRRAWGAKAAAVFGCGAAALALARGPLGASCALGIAFAILAWIRPRQAKSRPQRQIGAAFAATVLAFSSLLWSRSLPATEGGQGDAQRAGATAEPQANLHSGVVLLGYASLEPPLIAPPTPKRSSTAPVPPRKAIAIPFTGDYWFFFWPRHRPGPDASRKHGDPLALTYTAVDGSAVVMQARQPLSKPLDVGCCSAIDVILKNRESNPETVAVELVLVDSSGKKARSLSLGALAVGGAVGERTTLRYDLETAASAEPSTEPPIQEFNELLLWFHLKGDRRHRSAHLAVDRFELIP
ncbi:MAG: hypothetical protein KDC27_05070 [Acidobacteria bacterium]|nr:hypothetical protein [Acidobacteriota bacterium]